MAPELDHVAVAVSSLERGLALYGALLGLEHLHTEDVPSQKIRAAVLAAGSSRVELLEPTEEASPVARFIAKRGEGLHHIALRVEDLDGALEKLKQAGVRLIDEKPRPGVEGSRIAFLHPGAASGVLIELVERAG